LLATDVPGSAQSEAVQSVGLEVFLRRDFTERLGGFVSYTLSRTVATAGGLTERASWDRTHVLSVALGYDLGNGWRVGSRLFVESGRPMQPVCVDRCSPSLAQATSPVYYRPQGDLPTFWRLDVRLEKKWTFRGGSWITGTLECFNLFDRAEPIGDQATPGEGVAVTYQSAIVLPSVGLEAGLP